MKKTGFIMLLLISLLFSFSVAAVELNQPTEDFSENKIIVMEEVSCFPVLAEKSNDASMRTMQARPAEFYNNDASFEAEIIGNYSFSELNLYDKISEKTKILSTDFKSGGEAGFYGGTEKAFFVYINKTAVKI